MALNESLIIRSQDQRNLESRFSSMDMCIQEIL